MKALEQETSTKKSERYRKVENKITESIRENKSIKFLDELFYSTHKDKGKNNYEKFINDFLDDYSFFRKREQNNSALIFLSLYNAFMRYGTDMPSWKRLRI